MKVAFSQEAEDTLEDIKKQILSQWGRSQVIEFEKRVATVVRLVSTSPFIYQPVSKFLNVRKAIIHRNCSMFYNIGHEVIIVLFFFDNRQDPLTF